MGLEFSTLDVDTSAAGPDRFPTTLIEERLNRLPHGAILVLTGLLVGNDDIDMATGIYRSPEAQLLASNLNMVGSRVAEWLGGIGMAAEGYEFLFLYPKGWMDGCFVTHQTFGTGYTPLTWRVETEIVDK